MIEYPHRKLLRAGMGQIHFQPLGIQGCLVHTYQTNGGEMIVKAAQIPEGEVAFFGQLLIVFIAAVGTFYQVAVLAQIRF